MEHELSEEARLVAANILSGANACGTLRKAAEGLDAGYFAAAAEPVLRAGREELAYARLQRDNANRRAEALRFALEALAQNAVREGSGRRLVVLNGTILPILERSLGRRLFDDSG